MKALTEMWEKLDEKRVKERKDPVASKKEELLKRRKKKGSATEAKSSNGGAQVDVSADFAPEHAALMRSQIHLFLGNMLFERSQVQYKIGQDGWKKHLDAIVERFKHAGASEADISMVLKIYYSNTDPVEADDKNPKSEQ